MRFRNRAILFSFVPFALLLAATFSVVQRFSEETVRNGLRSSLRQSQHGVIQLRDMQASQNKQFLKAAEHDSELKATIQTLLSDRGNAGARKALQARLVGLISHPGIDLLVIADRDGQPIAGVVRENSSSSNLVPLSTFPETEESGLVVFRGEPFLTGSTPMQLEQGNVSVIAGGFINLSSFATPIVLLHGAEVIKSNVANAPLHDIASKLVSCEPHVECSIQLNGKEWLSLPILESSKQTGWTLHSLANVDEITTPINALLSRLLLAATGVSLLIGLLCSVASSRAVVQPLSAMVKHLQQSAQTGELPEFQISRRGIFEINELAKSYNRAAISVRHAQETLQTAYLEFVHSLANALDARDPYTAGHSKRVSDLSCAIAMAMAQSPKDVERLRVGALLHDIGKIGVSDTILQKPGKLDETEFGSIKKHPVIGRRILKGVRAFAQYLPAVELHHENWDGTGYPMKQQGLQTPLDARIIHVADAYDAMTTDRSYRRGRTHEEAMNVLLENAGSQFDPDVVTIFERITTLARNNALPTELISMTNLTIPAHADNTPTATSMDATSLHTAVKSHESSVQTVS